MGDAPDRDRGGGGGRRDRALRMAPSLRERRRRQTAREIQLATLRLTAERGFEVVTTEAIAVEAGVSHRTFFNYFPNKEAALVGEPPAFPEAALADFVAARGPLAQDLGRLIAAHVELMREERPVIEAIRSVTPGSRFPWDLLEGARRGWRDRLAAAFRERLPGASGAALDLLAEITLMADKAAVDLWIKGEAETTEQAVEHAMRVTSEVVGLLLSGGMS